MIEKKSKPTKQTPKFGIITPVAYMERYAVQSDFHLVLAHLVDTNDEYASFYKARSDQGDYIVCDNGAFELGESYKPSELIRLGHKCGADAIVLPDYPGQNSEKTISAAFDLAPEVRNAGFRTFFCPQSEVGEWDDYEYAYHWGSESPVIDIIGMSILAIPNALPNIPAPYARVVGTQILITKGVFNFDKYHHYLGLNAGPNLEIPALIKMNALDSCDSSNPVWSGINGWRYSKSFDSYTVSKKRLPHVDFDHPDTEDQALHEAIQNNIDMTLELFR